MERIGRASGVMIVLGALLACSGCRAALDEVTYRCMRERRYTGDGGVLHGFPYVEGFDDDDGVDGLPVLHDRCWQRHGDENADIVESESDLIIRPHGRAIWSHSTHAPSLTQHIDRDFVLVTRAEAVNVTGETADHCYLGDEEAAGLVVRRDEAPAGWLTFTVRPFELTDENCVDEPTLADPPRAIVERRGDGLGIEAGAEVSADDHPVGEDGEANIALCRQGDDLVTLYHDPAAAMPWREVGKSVAIGSGSLEVGLTTASGGAPTPAGKLMMEGHFNWAVLQHVGTLPGDGCSGVLEAFTPPDEM
jgi:hypothetical protein